MYLLEKIRNRGFWILDFLKGNKVAKHLQDINFILEDKDRVKSLKRKNELLDNILIHAVSTTQFYNKFKNFRSIHDFPIIEKNLVRNNFERFKSELYKDIKTIEVKTSGSTGLPFKVIHDSNKRDRNTADVLFFAEKAGYKIGDSNIYIKIWNSATKKSDFRQKVLNVAPVNILDLSDENIYRILYQLNKNLKSTHIISYVSAIEAICSYIEKEKFEIKFKIESVTTMSEGLSKQSRHNIERVLNTKVFARYSNNENGIIAQQCIDSDDYYINSASYLVEIFDIEKDILAEEGKLGRIVITDLFNYAMPMIRYDTGDLGIMRSKSDCSDGNSVFSAIEGRKMDTIYNTEGEMVSSYIVSNFMWNYTEILQYQFIQNGEKSYEIILNTDKSFKNEKILIKDFITVLGKEAVIKIKYVNEIPLLSSGKRKRVVNLWKK